MTPIRSARTSRVLKLCVVGVIVSAVLLAILAAAWRVQGGKWYMVSSSSMGEQATVGTLLLTKPVKGEDIQKGDFITFKAPESGTVYSHRVIEVLPEGFRTQGDASPSPDSWVLDESKVIGEVKHQVPALGTVLKGLPMLFIGILIVWLLTSRMGERRQYSTRFVGFFVVVAIVNWLLRPWVGLDKIQEIPQEKGVQMDVISTGLLPIRVSEVDGPARAYLSNGEIGSLHLTAQTDDRFSVVTSLDLSLFWWIVLILFIFSPLIWTLTVGLVNFEDEEVEEVQHDEV